MQELFALTRVVFGRGLTSICVWLLFWGCATRPPESKTPPSPPAVRLGAQIELTPDAALKCKVLMDPTGRANIFVLTAAHELVRMALNHEGVIQRERILEKTAEEPFDAVVDPTGTFHVLSGKHYFRSTPAGWNSSEAGSAEQIVAVGTNLMGFWRVKGSKVGAPIRLQVFGFGGYGGGIIWPWLNRADKFLIGRQNATNWVPVAVIEPSSSDTISAPEVLSTDGVTIQLIYQAAGPTVLQQGRTQIRFASFQAPAEPAPQPLIIVGHIPQAVPAGRPPAEPPKPQSAELVVFPHSVWTLAGKPLAVPEQYWGLHYAAAGTGRVHAVGGKFSKSWSWSGRPVIHYLAHSNGAWSSPVEVTDPKGVHTAFSGAQAIDLAAGRGGEAVVVFPLKHGPLVARWIEPEP